jgi:hypothetical protein
MPKTEAEDDRAAFWADIAARARTSSTPANTELEAHYLNERHDRARKVERTWRGEVTPERIAEDWEQAIAVFPAAVLACVNCGHTCACVGADGWGEGPACEDIDACNALRDQIETAGK